MSTDEKHPTATVETLPDFIIIICFVHVLIIYVSSYYNLEFLFSAFAITTKQSYYYYIKNHLDENLQLILFRLEELDEEFEDPVVEQGMVGDYLVQDSQMDWCMFCAKLEVAGLCHSTLHPPNYTNRHYWVPT